VIFKDRQDAGERLADLVVKKVQGIGLVLGIPRGGVVVAKIVADKLNWPLDILAAKKIGAPGNPELAVGAKVKPPAPQLVKKLRQVKQVILVDDGIATGYTMEAGIKYLQGQSLKVIVAVPVAAQDSAERLKKIADQWFCVYEADNLMAIGQFYEEFSQVSDEEVAELLNKLLEE